MTVRAARVSAPGRICLFGEHQDYLGLPVIAAAINLRIWIEGSFNDSGRYEIDLPDVGDRQVFAASFPMVYERERDYLRSVANVLWRSGVQMPSGVTARVWGNIPLNSGTASSSALCVAWTRFLLTYSAADKKIDGFQLAKWAHAAEVVEFGEPGGMMDHVLAAYGGICYVEFEPEVSVQRLRTDPGEFVLASSGQPKDTKAILARVRGGVERAVRKLREVDPAFDLRTVPLGRVASYRSFLSQEESELLEGALRNRDITQSGLRVLQKEPLDRKRLGLLLLEHQRVNRDYLKISTDVLDRMVRISVEAGAFGGKLNGSGGGGAMFAYAPEAAEAVRSALEDAGYEAVVVKVDEGARVELLETE